MIHQALMPSCLGSVRQEPAGIIVHAMGEIIVVDGIAHYAPKYINKVLGFSVHAYITPSGTIIRQREDGERAYHAKGFNTDTLGVEFLVPGAFDKYPDFLFDIQETPITLDSPYGWLSEAQYDAGVGLIRDWMMDHEIKTLERHSDVSPGRKKDPGGGFPWKRLLEDLPWDLNKSE